MKTALRYLGIVLLGALGMLSVLGGQWVYTRYREFVVMRDVVGQILKANAAPAPTAPKGREQ